MCRANCSRLYLVLNVARRTPGNSNFSTRGRATSLAVRVDNTCGAAARPCSFRQPISMQRRKTGAVRLRMQWHGRPPRKSRNSKKVVAVRAVSDCSASGCSYSSCAKRERRIIITSPDCREVSAKLRRDNCGERRAVCFTQSAAVSPDTAGAGVPPGLQRNLDATSTLRQRQSNALSALRNRRVLHGH
ncbi:hypothetical protein P3T18_006578 [Paraburkholderia sp. GAS199]